MYEYWNKVYENIIGWYEAADSKATAIVAVNALLLSFLGLGVLIGFESVEISTEVRIIFYAITFLFVCTITSSVFLAVLGVARGFEKPLHDKSNKLLTHPIDISEHFGRNLNKNQEEQALLKSRADNFLEEQIKNSAKEEDQLWSLALNITRLPYHLDKKNGAD
jgi:hypothetical protein